VLLLIPLFAVKGGAWFDQLIKNDSITKFDKLFIGINPNFL
jgi:hypothetical protein